MPAIPEPVLIGDTLEASLYRISMGTLLVVGKPPQTLPDKDLLRPAGPLTIRYALQYYQQEAAIVPGLFASEYGAMLVGREAWDYAVNHSNLHPRADLVGLRTDGREDQVMMRDLDLGRGVVVLAYEAPDATTPIATLSAYWASDDALPIPDLLAENLPRMTTIVEPLDAD